MAQAKKKVSTKTNKKPVSASCKNKTCAKKGARCEKSQHSQQSSPFFLITMSMLAAALLFADLFMMTA